jgi:hypothetical protein
MRILTASEVAFLALGLVLGLACGAALIEVFRARPSAAREVRVTVAPNAIHAPFASTLSNPTASPVAPGPAAAGPGDRRWHEPTDDDEGAMIARRLDDLVGGGGRKAIAAGGPGESDSRPPVPFGPSPRDRPAPLWLSPAPDADRTMVPVPMSIEPDPLTAALRSTAAAVATAAIRRGENGSPDPAPRAAAGAARGRATVPADQGAETGERPTDRGSGTGSAPAGAPAGAAASAPAATGPCADERRVAEERCAVATRARAGAAAAAEALRTAQRTYDEHAAAADAAAAASDPRAVRAAKEAAQLRFREARARAGSREGVETAARDWLTEINRINHETRDATSRVEKSRTAAAALAMNLERLAVEADAARISAERADEACVAAREAVAACDEARALEAAAARAASAAPPAPPARPPARRPERPAVAPTFVDEEEHGGLMTSGAGQEARILQILRGDRGAMQAAVARLAGEEADGGRRWQSRLTELAEALIARAIEASAFVFPTDHFFWGPFSQADNRDIAAGLSSLGFRFDGFGGWVDDRVPSQRDLSLAVGYAGLDPMRIRRWPNETEMRDLLSEVRVAADEYVASAAAGLTLGELVSLLGRRADALTELWNDWGTVRPVLLEGG